MNGLLSSLFGVGPKGYQQISQQEAKKRMDAGGALVLDVREPDEYNSGHIPGAVLLPLSTISEASAAYWEEHYGPLEAAS